MKTGRIVALGAALLAGGFAWGFAAHWLEVFPFGLLQRGAAALGWIEVAPVEVAAAAPDRRLLEALPYVSGTTDPESELRGVVEHDESAVAPGLNLYNSPKEARARLIDMHGRVLREWAGGDESWQHVELLPDGGLLAIVKYERLRRLGGDAAPVWTYEGAVHHDLDVTADGSIYAVERRERAAPAIHPTATVYDDEIVVLGSDGTPRDRYSLLDILEASAYAFLLPRLTDADLPAGAGPLDILHTNHVEVLDGSMAERAPLYAAGNVLVSIRHLHAVAVIDLAAREVVWLWGPGNLTRQHHPTVLPNGNILLFDNGVERSRVVELDPLERRIVWEYRADDFFSETRGGSQRLTNGNTLITESDSGYVFEVTPAGRRVWTFANPDVTDDGERAAIWRMTRFAPDDVPGLAGTLAR